MCEKATLKVWISDRVLNDPPERGHSFTSDVGFTGPSLFG